MSTVAAFCFQMSKIQNPDIPVASVVFVGFVISQ